MSQIIGPEKTEGFAIFSFSHLVMFLAAKLEQESVSHKLDVGCLSSMSNHIQINILVKTWDLGANKNQHHESTVHADESNGKSFGEELTFYLHSVAHNLQVVCVC